MYILSIKLREHKQESDFGTFERFMLDEVFPAIDKSPRRDGQVTGLVLLRGGNPHNHDEYLLLVHEQGGAGAARQQLYNSSGRSRISAFGAQISQAGDWNELDSWFAENAGTDQENDSTH